MDAAEVAVFLWIIYDIVSCQFSTPSTEGLVLKHSPVVDTWEAVGASVVLPKVALVEKVLLRAAKADLSRVVEENDRSYSKLDDAEGREDFPNFQEEFGTTLLTTGAALKPSKYDLERK